ncbi:MAG: nitric oxide reductase [Bacteroidetes bacterium HGW-Bacteroidetes-1]|jgi:nitric oxide reductase NorE protein|nr:MAG: nitric oxide reductase [Bacteroidetes bacterium HGW-Bacteroidetes-1]
MSTNNTNYSRFFYPPGGILIWMIVFLEIITFGIALIGLMYYGQQETEVFHLSRLKLNVTFGVVNTLFLLTSGYFMARSVQSFREKDVIGASRFMKIALVGGAIFVIIKTIEYYAKINAGLTLDKNMFFTFYWLLTGFHLVHVLVGMVILIIINLKMNQKNTSIKLDDVEAGAAFWHLCDLVWVLLFPALYLIF